MQRDPSSHPVNLVAALPAEAKPVASRLGLQRVQPATGFPLYQHDQIRLVVCGPGKRYAARAVSQLAALSGQEARPVWINLGIAGHAKRSLGEVVVASRIQDAVTGGVWHAAPLPVPFLATDELLTLDEPDTLYRREGMVDMEASGFFPTACRFTDKALVQVIKVISDNRGKPADSLSARAVRGVMAGLLDPLEQLILDLGRLAEELGYPGRVLEAR